MNKETLEELWEQATDLPDAKESPLAKAIISEALEAAGDGVTCDPEAAAVAVYRIATDCEDFANAIVERAQRDQREGVGL
ncbi:hypothetical protein LCGC14_1496770 [marine sediment metagenome]|uniref:Uncharacterized protein n=1 Tax=marine sediment metagenome TaxID=412755 RepID=A0A0F9J5T6_9ZZZZ